MTPVTRMFLIVLLAVPLVAGLSAQETTSTTTTAEEATGTVATETAAPEGETAAMSSHDVRNRFTALIRNTSPEVATILVLQPNLLANKEFMAGYPEIARFVAEHPEVISRPRFFLAEFGDGTYRRGPLEQILEPIMAMLGFLLVAMALLWIFRTWIEQRRWSRLSRTQSEVHNKILDRFGTSAELLEYIRTPAGTKFLESAPIPLHAERAPQNAPLGRIILSIQAGVIVAAAGVGMLLVSMRYTDDSGEGLFALGAIALCIGGGFIGSALVTLFLSRRLGLWAAQEPSGGMERGA
jgi:hypothetical protein